MNRVISTIGPATADPGSHHSHTAVMHPNYSPSADTRHSSVSPKSSPRSQQPPAAANSNDEDSPPDETDSGFTLMHPAFQRHAPKRGHETPNNPSIYGQSNNPSGLQQQPMHGAQDLTTTVNCSGSFVGHPIADGMTQGARSHSSTPDDSASMELDLTAHQRTKKDDEKLTNNNTC